MRVGDINCARLSRFGRACLLVAFPVLFCRIVVYALMRLNDAFICDLRDFSNLVICFCDFAVLLVIYGSCVRSYVFVALR